MLKNTEKLILIKVDNFVPNGLNRLEKSAALCYYNPVFWEGMTGKPLNCTIGDADSITRCRRS